MKPVLKPATGSTPTSTMTPIKTGAARPASAWIEFVIPSSAPRCAGGVISAISGEPSVKKTLPTEKAIATSGIFSDGRRDQRQQDHRDTRGDQADTAGDPARHAARHARPHAPVRPRAHGERQHDLRCGRKNDDPACFGEREMRSLHEVSRQPDDIQRKGPKGHEAADEDAERGAAQDERSVGQSSATIRHRDIVDLSLRPEDRPDKRPKQAGGGQTAKGRMPAEMPDDRGDARRHDACTDGGPARDHARRDGPRFVIEPFVQGV